ncbi:hypothetical protein EMCRGX_G002917 [Ephydatia muelleri]
MFLLRLVTLLCLWLKWVLLQKAASAVQNETIASSTDAEVDDGSDGIIHVVELHIVLGDLEEAGTTNELGMVSLRLDDELLGMDTELAWTMDELLGDSVDVVHDSIVHPEFGNAVEMEDKGDAEMMVGSELGLILIVS